MRIILMLVALLATATAWGQIDVPTEVDQHKLIVATLTQQIPDGAYLADGGWEIAGATATQVPDTRPDGSTLIWTGPPGEYVITYDGVLLQDVSFTDGSGNPVTIRSYVGRVKSRAVCTIKGGSPDPGPDPPVPPVPVEELGVVIVEDAAARTSLAYGQVQAMTLPDIRELPKWFRLVDKDATDTNGNVPADLKGCLEAAAKAGAYPHLILHDQAGKIVWQGAVPATADGMRELIKQYLPKQKPKAARSAATVTTKRYIQRTTCGPSGCTTTWEVAP